MRLDAELIFYLILIVLAVYQARYYFQHMEGFETMDASESNPIMDYAPDTPSPAEVYNNQPYHLLSDMMSVPRTKESISCVNSRSCYATDFGRMLEKTGTFRQLTNNYKRNYPDSCTAPTQELVLNFYKNDAMAVPSNHTG